MENKNFEYDSDVDSLHIYSENSQEIIGSIDVGDLIFDISSDGSIVGLEIDNASLKFNTIPEVLSSELKQARIYTLRQKNMLLMGFFVLIGQKEYNQSFIVPKEKIALTH